MNGYLIALFLPLFGTVLGAAFVFFMKKEMSKPLEKALLGFASGVMVAASIWSLLMPCMDFAAGDDPESLFRIVPAAVGFLVGVLFLLVVDMVVPHLHVGEEKPEGPRSGLSRLAKLTLAVTIHNLPEGMTVGAVLAGVQSGEGLPVAAATALSLGIAIQNVPEGAIISMPLRAAGRSKWKAFGAGSLSGVVEPIAALLMMALTAHVAPLLPYSLAFAAGAMMYVVVEELIPEAAEGEHSNLPTIGFAVGFTLMMVLDVVLG